MNLRGQKTLAGWARHMKRACIVGIAGTGLALNAIAATCDSSLYVSQDQPTNLYYSNGQFPTTFTSMGTATQGYNALGYNTTNDTLYGMVINSNQLVTVNDATGATTSVGTVTGLPVDSYNAGAFDTSGTYYVKPTGSNNTLYAINPSGPSATLITLSQSITISDMAWHSGLMYTTANSGQLYSIDVTAGTVTAIGSPDTTGGVLGAQFSSVSGVYGLANSGAGIFQVDLTTGARTLVSTAPASNSNDGASCPNGSFPVLAPPATPTSVPTLGQWALMLLAGALSLVAWRKRFQG